MRVSNLVQEYLRKRIAEVRAGAPGQLSSDGSALMVDGSIGYECYVSSEGSVFIENYDMVGESPSICDRSLRGQIAALVLGTRMHPVLRELLPPRDEDATTCGSCAGEGFVHSGPIRILCEECCGLGWVSPSVFQEPSSPPN